MEETREAQEKAWSDLPKKTGELRYKDIPWPDMPGVEHGVLDTVLRSLTKVGNGGSTLRALRMRWHPDKFIQNYGTVIHPGDQDKVMRRVNQIAQVINEAACRL